MATRNQQQANDIETNQPILNEKITKGLEGYNNYLESLKNEMFEEKKDEIEEDVIKRAESILDRLDEMLRRIDESNKRAKETLEIFIKMTELFNGIVKNIEDEKEKLALRNSELIDVIIDLEQRRVDKLIIQYLKRQNRLKGSFEDVRNEWNDI